MKILTLAAAVAVGVTALIACNAAVAERNVDETAVVSDDSVRHVVAFKYKADASPEQIAQVTDAFRALEGKIPGILSFEYGTNESPEGLDKGFTHLYLITFEDAAARDAYLPHPDHAAFGALLGELDIIEDVFVIDYVPQR